MRHPRVIIALLAVVVLSTGYSRLRAASTTNQWVEVPASVRLDGAGQRVTVAIPAGAVEHLHGPLMLWVAAPSGHAVAGGTSSAGAPFEVETIPAGAASDGELALTLTAAGASLPVRLFATDSAGVQHSASGTTGASLSLHVQPRGALLVARAR